MVSIIDIDTVLRLCSLIASSFGIWRLTRNSTSCLLVIQSLCFAFAEFGVLFVPQSQYLPEELKRFLWRTAIPELGLCFFGVVAFMALTGHHVRASKEISANVND